MRVLFFIFGFFVAATSPLEFYSIQVVNKLMQTCFLKNYVAEGNEDDANATGGRR